MPMRFLLRGEISEAWSLAHTRTCRYAAGIIGIAHDGEAGLFESVSVDSRTKKHHPDGWCFLERATRLELATSTLARSRSTR